jgi:predicted membrane protein
MGNSSSSSSSSGIGFIGVLTIAFIVLKLIGQVDWSWWWVLSPVWISAIITVSIIVFLFVLEKNMKKKQRAKRLEKFDKFNR